jgi:hypothetical protein
MRTKLIWMLLLLGLAGCCQLGEVSRLPGVGFAFVADAEYLPEYEIDTSKIGMGGRKLAAFRIQKCHIGHITNSVACVPLPEHAILVGTEPYWFYGFDEGYIRRGTMGAVWAPGGEPSCGILPNTTANRHRVANELGTLLRNPQERWISKQKAMLIAETTDSDSKADYATRYSHGWCINVSFKPPASHCTVFVGDDGRIKDEIGGL